MPTFECDLCIVGGGISAALLAQKVAELRPGTSIIVVEAGDRLFDVKKRAIDRQRSMAYGENPWPGDYVEDQSAQAFVPHGPNSHVWTNKGNLRRCIV